MAKRTIPLENYYNALHCLRDGQTNRHVTDLGILGKNVLHQFKAICIENNWIDANVPLPSPEELMVALNKTPHQCIQGLSNTSPGYSASVTVARGPDIFDPSDYRTLPTWLFVMQLNWSGLVYAECMTDQSSLSWATCHQSAFIWFNGVPSHIQIFGTRNKVVRECFEDEEASKTYSFFASDHNFSFSQNSSGFTNEEDALNRLKCHLSQSGCYSNQDQINYAINNWLKIENTFRNPVSNIDRYALVEAHCFRRLPDPLPLIDHWVKVKVHGNGHVAYQGSEYSVPYQYRQRTLWLRANCHSVQIFNFYNVMATHKRLFKQGEYSTFKEHIPADGLAWNSYDIQNTLFQAKSIGKNCYLLIQRLLEQRGLRALKTVQGILRLSVKFGNQLLENACDECVRKNAINYAAVKAFCELVFETDKCIE
jgi:hypothetical protein